MRSSILRITEVVTQIIATFDTALILSETKIDIALQSFGDRIECEIYQKSRNFHNKSRCGMQ